MNINKFSRCADFLAVPFWVLLGIYFLQIKQKSYMEYVLLIFSLTGLVADVFFSINYFSSRK